jgi:hypothetical protein
MTWVTGKSGSGYAGSFDGVNDYAASTATITYGVNIVTVCAWVNAGTYGDDDDYLFTSGPDKSDQFATTWHISTDYSIGSRVQIEIQDGSGVDEYRAEHFTPRPSASSWHHYAIVYDNSASTGEITVYIDGVATGTTIATNDTLDSNNFSTDKIYMAARGAGLGQFFLGSIDGFYVYSGALTSDEVTYVMNLNN